MPYVKVKTIDPAHIRRQIHSALAERHWSLDDLLRKLGYIHLAQGRKDFACLYRFGDNTQLLRRLSTILEIDPEELSGERCFDDEEEYLRFTFAPCLLRVPSRTTPANIFPVALSGLNAFLRVDSFPLLRKASERLQDRIVAERIREDYARRSTILNFGDIIGYAYYHAFGEARAYAVTGERLPDIEIVPVTIGATLRTNRAALAAHGGVIPRMQSTKTGEVFTNRPDQAALVAAP